MKRSAKRNTRGLKRGHSSKQAKAIASSPRRDKPMTAQQMAFAQAYLRLRVIADAAREIGVKERRGYALMKVPKVKAFVEKVEAKAGEIIVKEAAIDLAKMVEKADKLLDKVLDSPEHNFHSYKFHIAAAVLAYKRGKAFETGGGNANTPGNAAAAAINSTHVHLHTNQPVGVSATGEGVYEPRWIRESYGVNNPNADAIDAEYGGLDALPGRNVPGSEEVTEVEMETGDAGAMEGAE